MKLKCLYSVRRHTVVGATVSMAQFVMSAARTRMVPLIQPVGRYTQRVQTIELLCTRALIAWRTTQLLHPGSSSKTNFIQSTKTPATGFVRKETDILLYSSPLLLTLW